MAKSPAVILFDSNGVAMAVEDGVAIPVGTQALLAAGTDGTDAHVILLDSAGSPVVVGAGTAGTSIGGVLSIQGVTGGTAVPITGSVSATDPSVGANNAAAPGSSTQVGGSDGTNLQAVRLFDVDTGAGAQYVLGVGLRKAASGGSVEAGTATDPLRVDPTGVTAQPVTDNAGSLTVDTAQLPGTLVGGRLDSNVGAWLGSTAPTVGQKAMANSVPVVISSDQSTINVSGNFDNNSVGPTAAAVPAEATQIGGTDGTNLQAVRVFDLDSGAGAQYVVGVGLRKAASGGSVELGTSTDPVRVDPTGTTTQPVSAASLPLPTGAATESTLATRLAEATFTARINTQGQKAMAASTPVVLASDQTAIPVTDDGGSLTVDGSVAITSIVPGVGSTNLGKAEDAAAASGDTGVAILGVYQPDTVGVSAGTPGDYATLNVDDKGRLRVSPGAFVNIETFDALTGFTAFNTDAANLALTTNHVRGTQAITFDVVNSAANSIYGLIQKTLTPIDLSKMTTGATFIQAGVYLPSLTNVINVIVRLGTDSSNYNQWSLPVTDAQAGVWEVYRAAIGRSDASVGNGWNLSAITYLAVGVQMNAQNDTLAGIVFDSVFIVGGQVNTSDAAAEITQNVSSSKIDVSKVGGFPTQTNAGTSGNGTLRVAIASDDPNLLQIISNQTNGTQRTLIANGANNAAVKAASTAAVAADPALVVAISPNNTITTSSASVGVNNAAAPASSTQIGGTDGTNLQAVRVFDGDTGAGTQYVLGAILRKSAAGGTVEAGTASDPLRIDPTGTTTQPISAAALPLPTGAATEATLATRLADATFTARINTQGQKTMAASTPVVLASDQTSIPITDNGGSLTVDGAVTANIGTTNGLALDATLTGGTARTRITDGTSNAAVKAASTAAVAADPALVVAVSPNNTVAVSAASLPLPSGAATEATLATRLADATFTGRINTLGQKTSASSTPVVLASDQSSIPVTDNGGSLTVDGAVTANIGTTNGLALDATLTGGTARTRITDGTSNAAVKAASTAAVAADPALVVAISPNNTITTSNASVGVNNAALPASSTAVGGSDGTNLQAVRVFDGDTGAGTQYVLGAILRKSASGGTVEAGTSSDPLRIDPTGTTTQPVSGTVTANIGTTGGLALDATLTGGTAKAITRGGAKGATTAADVTSTAEGTDHQALDVQIYHGGTAVNPTQIRALTSADVVTAAQGTAAALSGYWPVRVTDGTNTMPTADTAARSSFHRVTDGTNTAAVKAASSAAVAADPALVVAVSPNNSVAITAAALPLPTGAATEATLATRLADATFTARVNTLGQKTAANSTPVVLASDQSAIPITDNAGSLTMDSTQLPAALVGGRLDSNIGAWLGSTAPTVGQKTMANSVPIVIASDQAALPINTVGTHANAWNAAVTGTNGNSTAIDCQYTPYVSVFGTSNGSTTISIQVSQNNTNFYTVDTISIGGLGGGDFGGNYQIGARYVRLQSSTSRTVTATIAGKD